MDASALQAALAADRAQAVELVDVAAPTLERLDRFVDLLLRWREKTNLVARSTIPTLWTRHIADSLQLLDLAPDARIWVDLGSGAGFPGLAIACALVDRPDARVHLVESNTKKAAFLREAVRITTAPAVVHPGRIEDVVPRLSGTVDVVTARALAPLKTLLDQSVSLLNAGALGLFPKGQDVAAELTEAAKYWTINVNRVPSRTDSKARIVVVNAIERRASLKA
jgi:16S rRNA (guanine527-N7)-methyltransferase